MPKELSQSVIRNVRIRECLAGKMGCTLADISITQAGRIAIEGRGTVVNNIDDFWSLLFGSTRIPRDPVFDEAAPHCMNCESWGDKWIKDLCRECKDPRNIRTGTIHVCGPVSTCGYFKARPDTTPAQDPPPLDPPPKTPKSKAKKKK